MNRAYAQDTNVSVARSRDELERYLVRQSATGFVYGWEEGRAMLGFTWSGRSIRLEIPLMDHSDPHITTTAQGKRRTVTAQQNAYEQMLRQRHRALLLIVKAKIEAVRSGVTTVDMEFGMSYVMPDGSTVADQVLPAIERGYRTGTTPELLPPAGRRAIEMGSK